jgi:integrase
MPRKFEMTWREREKRWIKKTPLTTSGYVYVSCRQLIELGLLPATSPPTKYASWQAANAWWKAKEAELRASLPKPLDDASAIVAGILQQTPIEMLRTLVERGQAAQKVLAMLAGTQEDGKLRLSDVDPESTGTPSIPTPLTEEDVSLDGVPANRIRKVVGGEPMALVEIAKTINPHPADPDKTVAGQVAAWVDWQYSRHLAGEISVGRWDAYKRNITSFQMWIGGATPITEIDGLTLENYFKFLAQKKAAGTYSQDYCKNLFGAAKNFITRLAELGLTPLPGNIRRLRFVSADDEDQTPTQFTVPEVKKLLRVCISERSRLFLLLMLNCGMYQNDIAELRDTQVDWEAGTITRKRSKRRKGGYKVTYKLWSETFTLLKKFRSEKERVLVSDEGNPLVCYATNDGQKMRRYDLVNAAYRNVAERIGQKKPLKVFRKTSANLLENSKAIDGTKDFRHCVMYFLAQAPRETKDRHYVIPSEKEFFEALEWLGSQYGIEV